MQEKWAGTKMRTLAWVRKITLPFYALFDLICGFFQYIIIYFNKRDILSTHVGTICCQQIILFDLQFISNILNQKYNF